MATAALMKLSLLALKSAGDFFSHASALVLVGQLGAGVQLVQLRPSGRLRSCRRGCRGRRRRRRCCVACGWARYLLQEVQHQRLVDLLVVGAVLAGDAGRQARQVAFLEARSCARRPAWCARWPGGTGCVPVPRKRGLDVAQEEVVPDLRRRARRSASRRASMSAAEFGLACRVGVDPGLQRVVLGRLARQDVAALVAVEHALAVLVVVVDAGDLARVLQLAPPDRSWSRASMMARVSPDAFTKAG